MGLLDQMQQNQGKKTEGFQQKSFDPFDQIGGATPSTRSNYPEPGIYPVLYCEQLKVITSRKGDTLFVAEFTILESNVESRPKGMTMSWVPSFRWDSTPGNVREFLAILTNSKIEEVTAEVSRLVTSETNPLRGRLIKLEATNRKREGKTDITNLKWVSIPEEYQEKAEELRRMVCEVPF